jgi:hypothetical protein
MMTADKHDLGKMYGECILYWMIENAVDGRRVGDYEMQEGSGLPDFEFHVGLDWLVRHRILDREEGRPH